MHFAFYSSLHFMTVSGTQTSGAALISFLKIIYLITFNQLGRCFVRWQWRGLPHAVQISEEVTRGWGRSNDNIGLHSSGDSSCVDTCQSGKAAKALCVRVCVYSWRKGFEWRAWGTSPKADRSSATWKRKQNRNWKAESIARRWDRRWGKVCWRFTWGLHAWDGGSVTWGERGVNWNQRALPIPLCREPKAPCACGSSAASMLDTPMGDFFFS